MEQNLASSVIYLCHYLADKFEIKFISAADGTALNVSNKMISAETTSIINNVGSIFFSITYSCSEFYATGW